MMVGGATVAVQALQVLLCSFECWQLRQCLIYPSARRLILEISTTFHACYLFERRRCSSRGWFGHGVCLHTQTNQRLIDRISKQQVNMDVRASVDKRVPFPITTTVVSVSVVHDRYKVPTKQLLDQHSMSRYRLLYASDCDWYLDTMRSFSPLCR